MKTVYKYTITPYTSGVEMPEGATILAVGAQGDDAVLWALVDSEAPLERRRVYPVMTGAPVRQDGQEYHGTAQVDGGIVVHVFEDFS